MQKCAVCLPVKDLLFRKDCDIVQVETKNCIFLLRKLSQSEHSRIRRFGSL